MIRLFQFLAVAAVIGAFGMGIRAGVAAIHNDGVVVGRAEVTNQCVASAQAGRAKADTVVAADTTRAQATGRAFETRRVQIQTVFQTLNNDALNEVQHATQTTPMATVDSDACVLPDARLLRWQAANAASLAHADPARAGAATAESDNTARSAAAADQRGDAGVGIQPPRGSPDVSPAGRAVLPALGLRASPVQGIKAHE